jgi:hypothetical protein
VENNEKFKKKEIAEENDNAEFQRKSNEFKNTQEE